jgi:hypothetical protein
MDVIGSNIFPILHSLNDAIQAFEKSFNSQINLKLLCLFGLPASF